MRFYSSLLYPLVLISSVFFEACTEPWQLIKTERETAAITYYQKGLEAYRKSDDSKALFFFLKSINADSTYTDAYIKTGDIMIHQKKYKEAEDFLSRIPASIQPNTTIYFLKGSAQFYQNKFNEAVHNLEKTVALEPQHSDAMRLLAQLYYRMENYEQAYQYLERLMQDSLSADYEKTFALHQKVALILNRSARSSLFEKELYRSVNQSNNITRGLFAVVMVIEFRAQLQVSSNSVDFADVSKDDPLVEYYKTAVGGGILENLPDGKFYPSYMIKRRNLAYYFNRLLMQINPKVPSDEAERLISDVDRNDLQYEAIRSVCFFNILTLNENGKFYPDNTVTGKEFLDAIARLKKMIDRL